MVTLKRTDCRSWEGLPRALSKYVPTACLPLVALALVLALGLTLSGCDRIGPSTEAEYLERAQALMDQGDYRAAHIELRNALGLNTEAPDTRRRLGVVYLHLNEPEEARRQLERARSLGAPLGEVALPFAEAWFAMDRFALIREQDVPADLPKAEAPRFHALRAVAFAAAADEPAVERELAKVGDAEQVPLQALARAHLAMAAGDSERAIELLERALATNTEFGHAWSLLGEYRLVTGDHEGADYAFTRAIETRPEVGHAYMNRAMVRLHMGDHEGARADVDALKDGGATHPGVHYLNGMLSLEQGQYGEARRSFEQALVISRSYSPALLGLGLAHRRMGNVEQAVHNLNRHVQESPGSLQGIRALAALYVEHNRVDDAMQLLNRVSRGYPGDPADLSELRGRLLLIAGDSEAGLSALRDASAASTSSQGLQFLAAALLRSGETEQALEMLERASLASDGPVDADLALAAAHLSEGRYQRALEVGERLLEKAPGNASAYNIVATALVGLNQFDEARRVFAEGLETNPGDPPLAMNLSTLELMQGDPKAAMEALRAIQARNPGHADSAMRLSQLAFQSGDREEGLYWLRHATEHRPDEPGPHVLLARLQLGTGDLRAALTTLDQAIEHHREHLQINVTRAEALERLGEPAQAASVLERLAEAHPDVAELHFRLARNRATLDDPSGSIAALRDALAADSDHIPARVALVRQLSLAGALDEARALFQRLEEAHGDRADVRAQAGWFAAESGDFAAAATQYGRALKEEQRRIWVTEAYAVQRRAGRWDEAIGTLRTWLEQNPGDAEVRHLLGTALLLTDRTEEAKDLYREHLSVHEDDPAALNNLAWLLREEDTAQALTYARRAHALAPDHPAILDTLGIVLLFTGAVDEAVAHLRAALAAMPEAPGIAYHLALAYEAQGERDEAVRLLRTVLDRHDNFPQREAAEALLGRL